MIISKDLFIFGEQIFATIIPEGGSSQASQPPPPQQHQQQQHQQQPAIINTAAAAAVTAVTTAAAAAATVAAIGAAEPVAVLEPLSKSTITTTTPPAKAAVTTVPTNGAATNPLPLAKQETVAVVVAAAAVAAAAAATAKKANFKIQKIPKEAEQQQQMQQLQRQPTKKTREKQQLQQQQQQQQIQSISNGTNGGIKINSIKTAEQKGTTTTMSGSLAAEKEARAAATIKAKGVAIAIVEDERAAAATTEAAGEDNDDDDEGDEVGEAALAEKEPLVKRNTIKIAAAAATTTAAGVTTTGTKSTITTNFALQQQQQQQREQLLLQEQLQLQQCQEKQQQQQLQQTDCRLQLEPEQLPLPPAATLSDITTTAAGTVANNASTTTSISAAAATAAGNSAVVVVGGIAAAAAAAQPVFNSGAEDLSLSNMGKTMLANKASSDHAMVTIPFISEQHRTLQLTFQNVNVLHNERKILSDVSGMVSPGEVLAIMGPSGSGKTTLLDCISGQRRIDSGSIYLNREPLSKKWRRKIGYVLQEEVFFSGLTLRETVMYTALLRLPEKMPKVEKVKLVDHIIDALELNCCQQTKFGDYLNRGLSGGEKKRANIACELLTNPLLMLLDEPTSGLDSHSAISLMKVLKRYAAQEQKTVVISVHQPSSQMFHMFDKLLLLYNGRTAYFGEVINIYRYFENIGVAIKPHYNPADFVLEQLKCSPDIREKLFVAAKESHGNFLNRNCITVSSNNHQQLPQQPHKQNGGITVTSPNGADAFGNANAVLVSDKCQQHDALINDIINNYYKDMHHNHNHHHINHDAMLTDVSCEEAAQHLWCGADSQSNFSSASSDYQQYEIGQDLLDYPTRFPTQFRVLSSRNFKEAKPRMLSKLNWFQTVGLALMAGAIWFQIPRTEEYLHDLQGWMFFSQTYWMLFALFGALNSFPSEREVISKERRSGAYRLSAYYLAKMFGELPLVITLPTVYLMISYPMLGCTSFKLFFLMLVFLLLNTIVAQSVGFFIGACCMDMNVSITLSALYTLATQLFGGYLSSRIPEGLSWIRYTSMIHYAYQNMQILEFREGPEVRCGNPSSFEICKNNATTFIPYDEVLRAQNSTSPLWLNTLVLMMFFLVFRGLGYAVLRYLRCPKA